MFWLDVDKPTETSTVHRDECVHAVPIAGEHEGVDDMLRDGGWFSFDSVGEAMRFHKERRLTGRVAVCGVCEPLREYSPEPMAKLNVRSVKTGCDLVTELEITETKSQWRRLTEKLLGRK
jgi:hypothetical protein